MINHWNRNNKELKQYLRDTGITYEMIGKVAAYSPGTIAWWMRYPLSSYRKEVIQEAVKQIVKSGNLKAITTGNGIDPDTVNYELKCQLQEMGISYSDIAKCLGVTSRAVWGWMNRKKPVSVKRRIIIDNAIAMIREERRLSYESD